MRGKELVGDAVNEFERRRDVPVRYSRTLVMKTIQAMKRIEEIRQRRVRRLWVKRMMAVKQQKTKALEKELEKHPNLVTNETLKRIALENREKEEEKKKEKAKQSSGLMEVEEV
eukprot:TRINITY_DN2085_c0_g2_i7.p3 TRINITY_DN2085_c0_g2~~TRINITY_DN2085_c0_g2_i7.p3  ORF type:complete len:114 (-),score=57.59 TRINITY_DN2085_c0_g2_i7:136-477(-)